MNNLVSLAYLNDYGLEDLKTAVEKGFEVLGLKNFFKPKMKVLLKICLTDNSTVDSANSTNAAVVRAVVDYLSKQGVVCFVADSPMKKHSVSYLKDVYLNTGMLEMANMTTCELNNNLKTVEIETPNGQKAKSITVLDVINDVDFIINIGKLKIHDTYGYIGALSNMFGLVPGQLKKTILNRMYTLGNFNDYILDIVEAVKNKLVLNILDGVVALEAENTQRMLNCLAMSENPYALDAVICDILNIKYQNSILKQAENRELWDSSKPYRPTGEKLETFKVEDFNLVDFDNDTKLPFSKSEFLTNQQRPKINKNQCKGCKICSKICPTNAISMKYDKNGELYAVIDYKKCIHCNKCVTACPYKVAKLINPAGHKLLYKKILKYNDK